MSSTTQKPPEADLDGWKGTIRRLYLGQRLPRKSVLKYLQERGLNATEAQLDNKLKQWRFRQKMTRDGWKFVRHEVSRRERAGKGSDVILSGIKLPPKVVYKETMRNRPLPTLGRVELSPSPEWPANLPVVVCSPAPMEIIVDWPPSLPWIRFQTQLQEHERRLFSGTGMLASLLPAPNIEPVGLSRLMPHTIWNRQYLPKISTHIGLVIPESWGGENLTRADILVSGSCLDKLRQILEVIIARFSNNIGKWNDIEVNWDVLRSFLECLLGSALSHNLLESRTMKAFVDNLFRLAFDASISSLAVGKRGTRKKPDAEISHQVMAWLLRAGCNPNRFRTEHPDPNTYHIRQTSVLQRAVTFGDRFQKMVNLLLQFGADIHASDENGMFSALQLVLDKQAMRYWSGSSPPVTFLQGIFIEKAMKDYNTKHSQILAEHAIRYGKRGLLKDICRKGFDMEFCKRADFGLSSEITAMTCAAQFCPTSEEDPWDLWLDFVLDSMPPNKRHLNNLPAQYFIDPLICAAGAGNNAAITCFLRLGRNPDAQNQDGIFPLIAAVAHGHINTCELLRSLGANMSKVGLYGLSAMHVAAMTGQHKMIQLLAGITKNKKGIITIGQGFKTILSRLSIKQVVEFEATKYTAFDIVVSPWRDEIRTKVAELYEESFKSLLRNGFYLSTTQLRETLHELRMFSKDKDLLNILTKTRLDVYSYEKRVPEDGSLKQLTIRAAILTGCLGVIHKHFKHDWELRGDEISTALSRGDIETTKSILNLGVDIKTKRPKDPSFLEAAIRSRDQTTIDWALAADPGYYDPRALIAAVELVLDMKPIFCYVDVLARRPKALTVDILESTAVGIAATGNNIQLLRDLLLVIPPSHYCLMDKYQLFIKDAPLRESLFLSIYIQTPPPISNPISRGSPLTYAVGVGRERWFSLMLGNGYQPDESTLFRAIAVGSLEQIKFIYGSSGLGDLVMEDPSQYFTHTGIPLTVSSLIQTAVKYNRTDVVQWLLAQGSPIGDWTENLVFRKSPLQYAVKYGNFELVNILLEHGVSPNEKPGKLMKTALQLAAGEGYIGIAKILVAHEPPADVNAPRSAKGFTALEAASCFGRLDMVQFLLSNDVETEGTGREQYIRAIKYAQFRNHVEIVNMLKAHREWTQHDEELFGNKNLKQLYDAPEFKTFHKDTYLEPGHRMSEDRDDDYDDDDEEEEEEEQFRVDKNAVEGNNETGFLGGTSTPWGDIMTLEEAEDAFISYGD